MKFNAIICSLLFAISFSSCERSRLKKEAILKSKEFFALLKAGDEKALIKLYTGFSKFDTYYKSDSARIIGSTERDKVVTVSVQNRFTNGYGKVTEKDIVLIIQNDSSGRLKIIDSKGLSGFSEMDEYVFGVNAGCISKESDTTDQQLLKALKNSKAVMLDKAMDVYIELKSQLRVVDWTWESGYGGFASGKGIVMNSSMFSVPNLKYKVTYRSSSGEIITSDDGYITHGAIDAGERRAFTFYTSYVGNATKASIALKFDDELIYKYLSKKDWTGNECEEYFKKHPESREL